MKQIIIVLLFVGLSSGLGYSLQKRSSLGSTCTPTGGKGKVKCGGAINKSCIELHPDNDDGQGVCQSDDVLPNCCAASPNSADRTARSCGCCGNGHKINVTIPYDEY